MRKRQSNRIPQTASEAERFLWHASGHIANVYQNTTSNHICNEAKQAMELLYESIVACQREQNREVR